MTDSHRPIRHVLGVTALAVIPWGFCTAANAQTPITAPAAPGSANTGITPGVNPTGAGVPAATPGASPAPANSTAGANSGASNVSPSTLNLTPAEQTQWTTIQNDVNSSRYGPAESHLRQWLTAHPDDRNAEFLLAYDLMFENKINDSVNEFDTLLAVDPTNGDYLYGKAKALVRGKRAAEAIPILDQLRASAAPNELIYRLEIEALRQTGDKAKMATVENEAATQFPATNWAAVVNPPPPVLAPTTKPLDVQLGFSYDKLDNGFADWHSVYVLAIKTLGPRENVYGKAESTEEFSFTDQQYTGGVNYPLNPRLSALVQVSFSPQHRVLPRYSLLGQLGYGLGAGFGIDVGVRHSDFDLGRVDTEYATLSKRFKQFLPSYTISLSEGANGGAVATNGVGLAYFYGGRNVAGIELSRGKTPVNFGPVGGTAGQPSGVITSDTTDVDLGGLHWVAPLWAVAWDVGYHDLSGFYIRHSISLGVRRRF